MNSDWRPASEEDLLRAAADGVLDENTTRIEFKQELTQGRAGNKKIAKEIASLSIHGGAILIGVVDSSHRVDAEPTSALNPVELSGLPERIANVAATAIDPPVTVHCVPIPSEADPQKGFVLVEIDASPLAPHMVDNRYYRRNDTAAEPMSDGDVVALHLQRQQRADIAERTLLDFSQRRPSQPPRPTNPQQPGGRPNNGSLRFVAVPLTARRQAGASLWNGTTPHTAITSLARPSEWTDGNTRLRVFSQGEVSATVDGYILAHPTLRNDQPENASNANLEAVEVSEHGVVRSMHGRVASTRDDVRHFSPWIAVAFLRSSVQITAAVSTEIDYRGQWAMAVGVDGTQGSIVQDPLHHIDIEMPSEPYSRTTEASARELRAQPGAVTERLFSWFAERAGIDHWHTIRNAFTDEADK